MAASVLFALIGSPSAHASTARYEGSSVDGGIVFFSTVERMVTGDTDSREDVFERSKDATAGGEYVTREVSIGPTGGNDAYDTFYKGSSTNGQRVFFATKESLVPQDTDKAFDVYMREIDENVTTLISQGDPSCTGGTCGNGSQDASVVPGGVVANGNKVFFGTTEKLAPEDQDGGVSDIYLRNIGAGTTVLISRGDPSCSGEGCGNGASPPFFEGASDDGVRIFFSTDEKLTATDGDGLRDLYARDTGTGSTLLVSSPGTCPAGLPPDQNCDPVFGGASNDGSHVFFETTEQISGGDTDASSDVYDWNGGTATLASLGPNGGNGNINVTFAGSSASGGAVYFLTSEPLDEADGDQAQDVYQRSGGNTTLISTGPEGGNGEVSASFRWASPDGSTSAVVFNTAESLVGADEDESQDVYMRSGTTTTLVSTAPASGNGSFDAAFSKASNDVSRIFFVTPEPLVGADEDEKADIYERASGSTSLISTGQLNGNGPYAADLRGIADNGSVALFTTGERLTEGDIDAEEEDVYQHTSGGTLLVSAGNALPLGPAPPSQLSTDPSSPNESLTPAIHGQAEEGTAIKIYTSSDCSGEPVQTGSGEDLATTGIQVTVAEGSTTSFRATAEAEGIVSACSNSVTYKQEYPAPPPPPPPTESEGGGDNGGGGKQGGSKNGGKNSGANGGTDYVTPETRITFGPSFKTRKRKLVFRFTDATGQPGTSFVCRLDRRRWRGCSSPKRLRGLRRGRHVFRVKARNAVGTWEAKPTKRTFKVVGGRR